MKRLKTLVLVLHLSTLTLTATPFALDEVSELFPHDGLEDRILFWQLIFAQYGERDVIFHDQDDLRLVYHIEHFDRERKNDPSEIRRQRDHLRRKHREIKALFDEIIRYGPNGGSLRGAHRKIIEALTEAGYEIRTETLQSLKTRIRYQRGIKEKFSDGLVRSGRYIEHIKKIFESYQLPTELAYLPHVESSFDYNAHSRVGAAGIWQITRGTGRDYLRINRWVDERLDPIRATDAAARLIRENYAVLGNWPLTITSYNHGKYGMMRAKKQYGSDLRKIIAEYQSRYFGFASKNFYAEFLAALYVARNYERYFGTIEFAPPLEFETLKLEKGYHASCLITVPGLTYDVLMSHNPHLRRLLSPPGRTIPSGTELRLPIGKGEPLRVALQSAQPSAEGVVIASDGSTRYRVQPGDVLGEIASSFGTSVRSIKNLNGLQNEDRIYVGQWLLIEAPTESTGATPAPSTYRVRSGDSLSKIAKRFNTSVRELARANAIADQDRLYPGMSLHIPSGSLPSTKYRVRRGDTLDKIARKFGTSVSSIRRANQIRNPHLIRQGQELIIP